jgi:N-methylhydantoinase B
MTREAMRKLPVGTYHGASCFDVPGGQVIDLQVVVTVEAKRARS